MTTEEIAVIGLGCRVPGADNAAEFWRLLMNGENHVKEVSDDRWSFQSVYNPNQDIPGKSYVNKAGLLKGKYEDWDNHLFNVSDREALCVDPQQRLALECCHMAFEDAGITRRELDGSNTGVYIGSMNDDFKSRYFQEVTDPDSSAVTGVFATLNSARVSFVYNLQGPSMTIDTACSSSLVAIHLGCQAILTGDCSMAVCGGVNCLSDPMSFIALSKARMLSPTGQCQAFSKDADGYARGEGCGVVIIKRLADALADGNKICGVIKTAVNQDGHAATPINAPAGSQQLRLLRDMYRRHNIDKTDMQVIEAHGTGTMIGDPTEVNALGEFFTEGTQNRQTIHIGSVKTNIGHLEGAAGVIGLIKLLLMLEHKIIVKSLFYTEDTGNPKIDFNSYNMKVPTFKVTWVPGKGGVRSGCVNSFGFGGTNAHLTLKSVEKERIKLQSDGFEIVALSAPNEDALKDVANAFVNDIETNTYPLQSLSYTSVCKRDHLKSRVGFTAESQKELATQVRTFLAGNHQGPHGRCPPKCEVVFVYCGVGTAWNGMCKELLHQPVFKKAVAEVDVLLKRLTKWSLLSKFEKGEEVTDDMTGPLSIFMCQIGLTSMWRHFGLVPDKLVGQSVGEVAAAYAAGCIDLPTAVKVIYHRTKALADVPGGGMMVVKNCDVTVVEQYCRASNGAINIAAYLSPVSCTVSGTTDGVARLRRNLEEKFTSGKLFTTALDVNCAYHSPQVVGAADVMAKQIADITGRAVKIPLYTSVTGKLIENKIAGTASYWKMNVCKPVLFQDAILSATDSNVHTVFVEIGPSPVLRAHAADILGTSNSYHVLPSMTKHKEKTTLSKTIANLFSVGVELSWDQIVPKAENIVSIPIYQFQRTPLIYAKDKRSGKPPLVRLFSETDMFQHKYIKTSKGESLELSISESTAGFVFTHIVNGMIVIPGATYGDVGFTIGSKLKRRPLRSVSVSLEFVQAIRIDSGSTNALAVTFQDNGSTPVTFSVTKGKILACTGKVREAQNTARRAVKLQELQINLPKKIYSEENYKRLNQMGFQYGPQLSLMRNGYTDGKRCLIDIELHPSMIHDLRKFFIHPCILDVMMQTTGNLISAELASTVQTTKLTMLPVAIGSIRVYGNFQQSMVAYAVTVSQLALPTMVKGHYNVALLDKHGNVVAEIENFVMHGRYGTTSSPDDLHYMLQWEDASLPDTGLNSYKDKILVINGSDAFVRSLSVMGSMETAVCQLLYDECRNSENVLSRVDQAVRKTWGRFEDLSGIIFVCESSCTLDTPEDVSRIYQSVSSNIIGLSGLIKALMSREFKPPLFVVTESVHGFSLSGEYCPVSLVGSELWGYLRNLYVEFMYKDITLVDISPSVQFGGFHFNHLVRTILTSDKARSTDYAIVRDKIYTPCLVKTSKTDISPTVCEVSPPKKGVYSVKSSNAAELSRIFTTPATNMRTTVSKSDWVELAIHEVCISHASFYPKTTTEADRMHDTWFSAETGHHMLALEYIGSEIGSSPVRTVKNTTDGPSNQVVACHSTTVNSICQVPRKCTVKLASIPFYQPGLLTAASIYQSVLDNISENQSVTILSSSPNSLSTLLCKRMIATKAKQCQVLDGKEIDESSKYQGDVIIVLAAVTKRSQEMLGQFSTLVFFKSAIPESLLNFFTFRANRNVVLIDETQIFVDAKLQTYIPKVTKWLQKNWASIWKKHTGMFSDFRQQAEITVLPCETIKLGSHDSGKLRAKLPLDAVFRCDSLYIVVGGLTGLGWEIVKLLAESGATAVATINRRQCAADTQSVLKKLQATTGCQILTLQADITSLQEISVCVQYLVRSKGEYKIRGVFQGAGILDSALLTKMTEEQMHKVLKPKIIGTMNLHIATKNCELDFFLVQSSIAAIVGSPGQTSYGGANSFLDTFVQWRRQKGLSALVINWGALGVGMAADERVAAELERRGHLLLSVPELKSCFMHALLNNKPGSVYAKLNKEQLAKDFSNPDMSRVRPMLRFLEDDGSFKKAEAESGTQKDFDLTVYISSEENIRLIMLSEFVLMLTQSLVGGDPASIQMNSTFIDIGIDSISSLTISNIIYNRTAYRIPADKLLASELTLLDIANHLMEKLHVDGETAQPTGKVKAADSRQSHSQRM